MFFKKLFIITFIILFALSLSLLFAYERPELEFRYVKVKEGDTFYKLFKDKWEIVSRINKIDEYHLLPDTILKVPLDWELAKEYPFFPKFLEQKKEIPKSILVVIQEQFLAGYEFGELKFWYPVCSGKEKGLTPERILKKYGEYPTPRGEFTVLCKDLIHKSNLYPKPNGGWPMPFTLLFSWTGYGFHAWGVPDYLKEQFGILESELEKEVKREARMPGWPASHGCVRLFIEDAHKLFKWARVGTTGLIIDSFEDLK